jgi:hypothetical protein
MGEVVSQNNDISRSDTQSGAAKDNNLPKKLLGLRLANLIINEPCWGVSYK